MVMMAMWLCSRTQQDAAGRSSAAALRPRPAGGSQFSIFNFQFYERSYHITALVAARLPGAARLVDRLGGAVGRLWVAERLGWYAAGPALPRRGGCSYSYAHGC